MEPFDMRPERQQGDGGKTGQTWQILEEFPLQIEGGEEELAYHGAAGTESALQTLHLPPSQLELLKSAVSLAVRNAFNQSLFSIRSDASGVAPQPGLPIQIRIMTPIEERLSKPVEVPVSSRAWGYFMIEKRVAAGLKTYPVIELFLYPEGSL